MAQEREQPTSGPAESYLQFSRNLHQCHLGAGRERVRSTSGFAVATLQSPPSVSTTTQSVSTCIQRLALQQKHEKHTAKSSTSANSGAGGEMRRTSGFAAETMQSPSSVLLQRRAYAIAAHVWLAAETREKHTASPSSVLENFPAQNMSTQQPISREALLVRKSHSQRVRMQKRQTNAAAPQEAYCRGLHRCSGTAQTLSVSSSLSLDRNWMIDCR